MEQLADLGELVEEFHATRTRLESSLEWHRRIENAAREFERRLVARRSSSVSIPDTLIVAVLAMPTLELPTADLQHIQQAADLPAIDDRDLRRLLTVFPRGILDVQSEELLGSELVRTRLAPEIEQGVDISGAWLALADMVLGREPAVPEAATMVPSSSALRSMLAERAFHAWAAVYGVEGAIGRVDRIIEGLESYASGGSP